MRAWVPALLTAIVAGTQAGCAASTPPAAPSATPTLLPLPTRTLPPVGVSLATVVPLPTLGPSPTPRAYTVRAGDQFLRIALAFGLTREELLAANPGINPDLLSIGQQLLIPAPGAQNTPMPIPTPTPLPLDVAEPRCFPNAAGGVWCLATVTNSTESPVEGLSGLLTLVDRTGTALLTVPVYPPLNLVPPGRAMVLAAYLPPPVLPYERTAVTLITAVPVGQAESRFADMDWSVTRSQARADRCSWEVDVQARLPVASATLWQVSFAVLAFDDQGAVVGYAKWQAEQAWKPGDQLQAALTVYSLGPQIDRIDVLAEGIPAPLP